MSEVVSAEQAQQELVAYIKRDITQCPTWLDPVIGHALRIANADEAVWSEVRSQPLDLAALIGTSRDGGQLDRLLALLDLCLRAWLPLWLGAAGCVQARDALRGALPLTPDAFARGHSGVIYALDVAVSQSRELERPKGLMAVLDAGPSSEALLNSPVGGRSASAWKALLAMPEISSASMPATAMLAQSMAATCGGLAVDVAVRCMGAAKLAQPIGTPDWEPLYVAYAQAAGPVIRSMGSIGGRPTAAGVA